MACPFSRGFEKSNSNDDTADGGSCDRKNDRFKPTRQSSVLITSSLLGEEIDDQEDTQTLNLKHLRAAVLILTNPSVFINFY